MEGVYLGAALPLPGREESSGLVRAHAQHKLPLRVPAEVLHCVKVAGDDHSWAPIGLLDTHTPPLRAEKHDDQAHDQHAHARGYRETDLLIFSRAVYIEVHTQAQRI